MSDTAATAEATPTDTTPSGDGAVERRRRGGRKSTRTPTDLRSVVLGCRVDQATADEFADLASLSGTDRASLLASLVAGALSRPAPVRHDHPPTKPEHKQLSPLLKDLNGLRAELREGHGALTRLAGITRAEGEFTALGEANQALKAQQLLVERIEALTEMVTDAIERIG